MYRAACAVSQIITFGMYPLILSRYYYDHGILSAETVDSIHIPNEYLSHKIYIIYKQRSCVLRIMHHFALNYGLPQATVSTDFQHVI